MNSHGAMFTSALSWRIAPPRAEELERRVLAECIRREHVTRRRFWRSRRDA